MKWMRARVGHWEIAKGSGESENVEELHIENRNRDERKRLKWVKIYIYSFIYLCLNVLNN